MESLSAKHGSLVRTCGFKFGSFISVIFLAYLLVFIDLLDFWINSEEYNFGLIIPFVIGYFLWEDRELLLSINRKGNIFGWIFIVLALLLLFAASIADLDTAKYYSLVLLMAGIIAVQQGFFTLKYYAFPLFLLTISIPLPYMVIVMITNEMQLISTNIGVWFIRLMGLPVLQIGNVIDMGHFKMLVEEACSGLRYLFPLLSISLILAHFYRGSFIQKTIIFVSAIPITIVMNSFRIAFTGWLIKNYGSEAAEGFLHDFEGWVVFLAALMLLVAFAYLLSLLSFDRIRFIDRFSLFGTKDGPKLEQVSRMHAQFGGVQVIILILIFTVGVASTSARVVFNNSVVPDRKSFNLFPFFIADRRSITSEIDEQVLKVLKADDYLLADFVKSGALPVNLYIAYYAEQKDGRVIHSPKDCLPGGGWKIVSSQKVEIENVDGVINKAIIQYGEEKKLVYYWIQQQGNVFASELNAKISLMKSSVLTGRSDGALVRIIAPIEYDNIEAADREIRIFINNLLLDLSQFIPS